MIDAQDYLSHKNERLKEVALGSPKPPKPAKQRAIGVLDHRTCGVVARAGVKHLPATIPTMSSSSKNRGIYRGTLPEGVGPA